MRKRSFVPIVLIWILAICAYAYHYAATRVGAPDAVAGYETTWRFQLLMFALFRLPFLLIGLGLLWRLWEYLHLRLWTNQP
jgi:hypothetical protein